IYVSLKEGDVSSYRVTFDPQGKILAREALRPIGGQVRLAPPAAPGPGGGGRGGVAPSLRANDWNTIQIILDADIVRYSINGGGFAMAATEDKSLGFGPIALYAGSGEVQFK